MQICVCYETYWSSTVFIFVNKKLNSYQKLNNASVIVNIWWNEHFFVIPFKHCTNIMRERHIAKPYNTQFIYMFISMKEYMDTKTYQIWKSIWTLYITWYINIAHYEVLPLPSAVWFIAWSFPTYLLFIKHLNFIKLKCYFHMNEIKLLFVHKSIICYPV